MDFKAGLLRNPVPLVVKVAHDGKPGVRWNHRLDLVMPGASDVIECLCFAPNTATALGHAVTIER